MFSLPIENGTPIINGQEWFEKMDYITCDPVIDGRPSAECGGYNDRWMGAANPAYERAAAYFKDTLRASVTAPTCSASPTTSTPRNLNH